MDTVLTRWITTTVSREALRKVVSIQIAVRQFSLAVSVHFRHTPVVTWQNFAAAVLYLSTLTKLICFSTPSFWPPSSILHKCQSYVYFNPSLQTFFFLSFLLPPIILPISSLLFLPFLKDLRTFKIIHIDGKQIIYTLLMQSRFKQTKNKTPLA